MDGNEGRQTGNTPPATKKSKKLDGQVLAGIIGATATIAAVLLSNYLSNGRPVVTPTPIVIIITTTPLPFTPILPTVPTDTFTPVSIITPVPTSTFTPTPSTPLSETIEPKEAHMILISAGEFKMGRDVTPREEQNVKPAHEVDLDAYYIDKYEVTNGAYAVCVKAGICKPPYNYNSSARKGYYIDPGYANFPVIYVDWFMAKTYCEWRGARLPTEAEWEKAARDNNSKNFPWSANTISCSLANYGACGGDTTEVDSHPNGVSPYGVYDLAGNVWEWVSDWYQYDYYSFSPHDDPSGPLLGDYRVARGGDWNSESVKLWVTYRNRFRPDYNAYNLGFRCAKNP